MIKNIGSSIDESLDYYRVISLRDSYFSELIAYFRESVARNYTLKMTESELTGSTNTT
jgi:hypothetical protein